MAAPVLALAPVSFAREWQPAPVIDAIGVLLLLGYCYLSWRVRRDRPARPWPAVRTASFLAGLTVIVVATQSVVAVEGDVLFSAHMVQHLLLIMVAPPLLVCGRPVTLLLHAAGNPVHRRVLGVLRSGPIRALTWPPGVTACYVLVVAGTHTPPVMDFVVRNDLAHVAEHALYLVGGYLFFLPVVGSEPLPRHPSVVGRYLMLLVGMQADTAVGVLLAVQGREVFTAYAAAQPASGLADLHLGGVTMWIGSDLVMVVVALAIAVSLVARRSPARPLAAETALLAAHNAAIERLAARHGVWPTAAADGPEGPPVPPGP